MKDRMGLFLELVRRTAAELPPDVEAALARACDTEEGTAKSALVTILENVRIARERGVPLCQDTGAPIFFVRYPRDEAQVDLERELTEAIRVASERSYLRPNAVCALTGKNSGDNTGNGVPVFHFHQSADADSLLEVSLMLKGGGSENVSAQYSLPNGALEAGRNLEGVRRAVIDAVHRAQGQGCAPGVIGVGIGGNRDTGYEAAKRSLLRPLEEKNPNAELAALEDRLMADLATLGIGPMGFGGRTTVLGVKTTALHRLPASFFVSVAYTCWALRRNTLTIRGEEVSYAY